MNRLRDVCLSLFLSLLLGWPFPLPPVWRLWVTVWMTLILTVGLRQFSIRRQEQRRINGFDSLIADLAARLSQGETLERAVLLSCQNGAVQGNSSRSFQLELRQVANQLDAGLTIEGTFRAMFTRKSCLAVQFILLTLPRLQQLGGRIDRFVQEGHRMRSEIRTLEAEIQAEQGQYRAEALIMACLPFIFLLILNQIAPDYQMAAAAVAATPFVYSCCLLLACLALVWVMVSRQPSRMGQAQVQQQSMVLPHRRLRSVLTVIQPLIRILASLYGLLARLEWTQPLVRLLPIESRARTAYFQVKLCLIFAAVSVMGLWVVAADLSLVSLLVAPLGAMLIQDISLIQNRTRLINRYRLDYPPFCLWLVSVLKSGFTVTQALSEAQSAWVDQSGAPVITSDLKTFQRQTLSGRSSAAIVEDLADKNPVLELQVFWHTVGRYDREGGSDLLERLDTQAQSTFQILRNGRRQQLGERSLMLLIPMMIDLLVILLLFTWPAASLLWR